MYRSFLLLYLVILVKPIYFLCISPCFAANPIPNSNCSILRYQIAQAVPITNLHRLKEKLVLILEVCKYSNDGEEFNWISFCNHQVTGTFTYVMKSSSQSLNQTLLWWCLMSTILYVDTDIDVSDLVINQILTKIYPLISTWAIKRTHCAE